MEGSEDSKYTLSSSTLPLSVVTGTFRRESSTLASEMQMYFEPYALARCLGRFVGLFLGLPGVWSLLLPADDSLSVSHRLDLSGWPSAGVGSACPRKSSLGSSRKVITGRGRLPSLLEPEPRDTLGTCDRLCIPPALWQKPRTIDRTAPP